MTTRKPQAAPKTPVATGEGGLYTSEDLFGDYVDTPPVPVRARDKTGPVKVRVDMTPPPAPPPSAPSQAGQELPPEVAKLLDAFGDADEPARPTEPEPDRADVERLLDAFSGPAEEALRSSDSQTRSAVAPPVIGRPGVTPPGKPPSLAPPVISPPEPPRVERAAAPAAPPIIEREHQGLDPDWDSLLRTEGQGAVPTADLDAGESELGSILHSEAALPLEPNGLGALLQTSPEERRDPSAPLDALVTGEGAPRASRDPAVDALFGSQIEASSASGAEPPHEIDDVVDTLLGDLGTPPAATNGLDEDLESALGGLSREAPHHTPPPETARPKRSWRDDRYGPYTLLDRVAVGGMAEVFKARYEGVEGFEKIVAVKRILPHLSDNPEFVEMFVEEAKMVAGLSHANIVQIHDLGRIESSYFIAMEFVHGRDLRSILRRAREKGMKLPLDMSLLIVREVCAALDYAHRKRDERGRPMRIVHRDVSPQNILISFEGDVKLADFGIAKAATKASSTEGGALRGKLMYMSPEQAWGHPMDGRSDIFSLGLVLYEMVTDVRPFVATSEMSILEMVRACRIRPPRESNPRIPDALDRAILKALSRDVDDRYQDAGEMGRTLDRVFPDRHLPSQSDLAAYLAVLFDLERDGHSHHEPFPEDGGRRELHLEEHAPEPPAPASSAAPDPPAGDDDFLAELGLD